MGLVVATVFLAADFVFGVHGDGHRPIRVTGRVVRDGVPVAGVWVMTLFSDEWKNDPETLERWKGRLLEIERAKSGGYTELEDAMPLAGGATTAADGTFDFRLLAAWGDRTGAWTGIIWREEQPKPFACTRYLLVELPGGPVYVDATKGKWTEHGAGHDPFATLDFGTVRVE